VSTVFLLHRISEEFLGPEKLGVTNRDIYCLLYEL